MARRSKFLIFGLPLVAIIAAAGAAISISRTQPHPAENTPVISPPVQPGTHGGAGGAALQGYIGAAGLVEPNGEEVAIGAHRSGVIESVKVTAGDTVKAGETLFVLDQRAAKGAVDLRRAELLAAERRRDQTVARTASLKAQVEAARAAANAAQAEMEEWADQLKSGEELLAKGGNAISQREVTRRRNTERSAQARLEEARARIVQLEEELKLIAAPNGATLAVDEAAVEQARRMLETAEIDLGLLDVRAPINATVLQVNVRPGEFAFAGTVVTPLIILGNLDPLHVRVDIDEGDVSRFSPAATAYASLRGQPNERMQLKFVRVEPIIVPKRSLTGAAGERVDTRVLRVIYALPSDSGQAFSGQQVDVFIESVGRRAQVSQSAP
jgi:multidrug resistance efflux pump